MDLNRNKIVIDCEDDGIIIYTRTVPITASLMWGSVPCVLNTANCDMNISVDEGGSDVGSTSASFSPTTNPTVLSKTFTFTRGKKLGSGEITVALKGTADSKTYTKSEVITVESSRQGPPGDEGIGGFKSIVFRRTNTELTSSDTPEGGDYSSPYPTSPANTWFDGIPEGEEKIWASSCTFYSNNTDTGWSTPRSMSDTEYYDVEFAGVYNSNTLADTTPPDPVKWEDATTTNKCNSWRPASLTAQESLKVTTQIWFDPKKDKYTSGTTLRDFTKMYWRAERECRNGEWGDWTKTRIKGEGETWVWTSVSSIVVNTNSAGELTTGFSKSFTAKLYHGDAFLIPVQNSSSVSYSIGSIQISTINSNTGSVSISMSMDKGAQPPVSGNITITLNDGTYSSTTTIPVIVNKIAQSSFKSTMFVRMDGTPTKPADDKGSFSTPSPTGCTAGLNSNNVSVDWSDGIPAGSDSIWATSRRFTSDGVNQDSSWSDPTKMADNDYYDVEFAKKYSNGTLTDTTPPDPVKSGTGANCNGSGINQIWYDPKLDSSQDFTKMYWRAEREYKNGSWGSWVKLRIKGETGNDGVGIESIIAWYKISSLYTGIVLPPPNVSPSSSPYYWYNEYIEPTEEKPYLWKFIKTTYTDSNKTPTQSEPELVRVWSRGNTNPNLLDDTDFESTNDMDAWHVKGVVNGSSSVTAATLTATSTSGVDEDTFEGEHYSYFMTFRAKSGYSGVGYIQFLEQYVYKTDQTVKKIEPNQWYTLSFYVGGRINTNNGNWSDSNPFLLAASMKDVIAPVSTFYVDETSYQTNTTTDRRYINIPITDSGEGSNNPIFDKHVITFKTPSEFTENMAIRFQLFTREYNEKVWFSMPKMEFGKVSTGYTSGSFVRDPFPRTSAWAEGNWYYRGNYGEPFLDVVTYGGSWFRCRESHLASDLNKPIFDQKTTFWEPASNLDFIATKLVLAETAFIENLRAGSLRTGYNGIPHVEMIGPKVAFYGKLDFPNIVLETDEDDCGVLSFYDKNGTFLYNLGPGGLRYFNSEDSKFEDVAMYKLTSTELGKTTSGIGGVMSVRDSDLTTYYRFVEGCNMINSTRTYKISGSSVPSTYNYKIYMSANKSSTQSTWYPTGTPISGWFIEHANNGEYTPAVNNLVNEVVAHYTNGKKDGQVSVYWNGIDNDWWRDMSGSIRGGLSRGSSFEDFLEDQLYGGVGNLPRT